MRGVTISFTAAAAFFSLYSIADARVHIDIDLDDQLMHVDADSGEHYDWAISSGRPGHGTPSGVFHPQRMFTMVHSAKYNNAPMPHAIFYSGPYAIHGTDAVYALGHVASHGCVRISPGNAATLFAMVKEEGATIVIHGSSGGEDAVAANPHRAGHRLAAAQRQRFQDQALGYAGRHHSRTLREWMRNPLAG